MKQTKIILFRGGFAGDLFTALHNMSCLIELKANGKVDINKELLLLQSDTNMSIQEKDQYYKKHDVVSCCDSEFALKHHNNTLVIKCDDELLSSFFCKRFKLYHPKCFTNITLNEYTKDVIEWNNFWPKKFKHQLDISDIFSNKNFLDKLNIPMNDEKETLFQRWKVINEKNFVIHKEIYGQ